MNPLKKKILVTGAALAILQLAIPPWQSADKRRQSSMGYAFISSPPDRSEIDLSRLSMGLLAVAILGFVVLKVKE